jgi:hypothetical protein
MYICSIIIKTKEIMTYETLSKKFDKLNKSYVKLNKSVTKDSTEEYCTMVSLKLEEIQYQMSLVSNELEKYLD